MPKIYILVDRTGSNGVAVEWDGTKREAAKQARNLLRIWSGQGQNGRIEVQLTGQKRPYFKGWC